MSSSPSGSAGEPKPAFAGDPATWEYYEQRAAEYDEWYTGDGQYASRDRPGWNDDVQAVIQVVRSLSGQRTLDVACGTGFLGRHLNGEVVGLDRSLAMARIARGREAEGRVAVGDALVLPFRDCAFDRVMTGHFYGHLPADERSVFLREARRIARRLVVVDSAVRVGVPEEGWQDRMLNDGSRHRVYKRYFTGAGLAAEIAGRTLHEGRYFVVAVAELRD